MDHPSIHLQLLVFWLFFTVLFNTSYADVVEDPDTTNYVIVSKESSSNPNQPEKAQCLNTKNHPCRHRLLTCPRQCPKRNSNKPGKSACFIDCSYKCEAICKHRKPNCYGYGAVCYDPRFVGGDGTMFYFHGKAGGDFCLVSDDANNLHINAHFIGIRPEGRSHDFTWVQAVGMMFEKHEVSVGANKVGTWEEKTDHLHITYDGHELGLPQGDGSSWTSPEQDVRIERLADTNSVRVSIDGIMTLSINVVPITQRENTVHNYHIPSDDSFAHLELQFKFLHLSPSVEGVLGQTYRPGFRSPVKRGVPMPIMGGEDKYLVSSLFATDCKVCTYHKHTHNKDSNDLLLPFEATKCESSPHKGGIVCRR